MQNGQAVAASNLGIAYENGQCNGYVNRIKALGYYRKAANEGDQPSAESATRVERVVKNELIDIAATPSLPNPQSCVVRNTTALYDEQGTEIAEGVSGRLRIVAHLGNNEFAKTTPQFIDGHMFLEAFVEVADLSCVPALSSDR